MPFTKKKETKKKITKQERNKLDYEQKQEERKAQRRKRYQKQKTQENAEQNFVDTKNVRNHLESRHGKHRDPEYKKKWRWEKLAWAERVPVSHPYSQVAVIDVYPDGNFALPPEEQSFLIKKVNSAGVGELLSSWLVINEKEVTGKN